MRGIHFIMQLLLIFQIIISILLVTAILMQRRSGGLSPTFGGGGGFYRTRRGVERTLFFATIGLSVLFIAIALLNVLLR